MPPEVLQFESQVVPGLGEHGKGAPIGDPNEVGNSSLKGRLILTPDSFIVESDVCTFLNLDCEDKD